MLGTPVNDARFTRQAVHAEGIFQALCRLGAIACLLQDQIAELEINPLFVLPDGAGVTVGDALAALR